MSTSDVRTASPSPLTPSGFLPDEAAFKRGFDAEYSQALASAKSQLGESTALAPRVVETAFLNTWAKRSTIATQEQFRSTLSEEVRHGTARALSRKASGGRFGAVGGAHAKAHEMSADHETAAHAWSQIERSLHAPVSTAESREATAAHGRHEAASHMRAISKRPGWLIPVAIGVGAIAVSAGGMLYIDRIGEDDGVLTVVSASTIQPIASNSGQIGSVTLGDGTKMRLGPESKVFIPDGFATKNRAIKVEGTASFDVSKGQTLPFRVVARRNQFIATGTKFVVSTFTPDSMPMLLVQEGSVTIHSGKNIAVVNAGQAMAVSPTGIRAATDDEKAEQFGWVDGRITVRNRQLRQVVGAMTRWFNYDVKVPDTPLLDRPAALDVPLDSSRLAITQVEKSANVKFAYEGDTKVFRDANAAPAKKGKK